MSLARAMALRRRLARDLAARLPYSISTVYHALELLEDTEIDDPLALLERCAALGISPLEVATWAKRAADQAKREAAQAEAAALRARRFRRIGLVWHGAWLAVFATLSVAWAQRLIADGDPWAVLGCGIWGYLAHEHFEGLRTAWAVRAPG